MGASRDLQSKLYRVLPEVNASTYEKEGFKNVPFQHFIKNR